MKTTKNNFIHCFTALLIVILLLTSFMAVGYSAISQKSEANATSPRIYYFTDCEESSNCIDYVNSSLSYSITVDTFTDEYTFFSLYINDYFYLLDDYDYIIFESRYHSFELYVNQLEQLFYDWKTAGAKIMFIYGFDPGMMTSDYFLNYVDIFITTDVFTYRFFSLIQKIHQVFPSNGTGCILSNSTWIINEGVELMPFHRFDNGSNIRRWWNFSEDFFRKYLIERYRLQDAPLQTILEQLNIQLYLYNNEMYSYYNFNSMSYTNDLNLNGRNLVTFWSTYDRAYGANYPILNINYMDSNDYFNYAESANTTLNFCSYIYNNFCCDSSIYYYRNGLILSEFDEDLIEMIYSFLNNEPLAQYNNMLSQCNVTHIMERFGDDEDSLPFFLYNRQWNSWNLISLD